MGTKKKLLSSLFMGLTVLSLTACSSTSSNEQQNLETESNVIQEAEGDYTIITDKKGLALSQTQGSVNYIINNIRVSSFKPIEAYKNQYKGKDVLTCVEMDFEIENTSSNDMSIRPMTTKLLLDDKTQIEQDHLKSDSMYSDLSAGAKIQGKLVFYIPDENAPKHFKLFCEGPVLFNDEVGAKEYENYELDINID